jgi:hypothetical protein
MTTLDMMVAPEPMDAPHLDDGRFHLPVSLALELARPRGGARIGVVDERDAVADEDGVLDGDALADEGVRRDLAATSHRDVLLDLDEGPDLVSSPMVQPYRLVNVARDTSLPESDVGRDGASGLPWSAGPFPGEHGAGSREKDL